MTARCVRHGLGFICLVLASVSAFAQGTPLTVGPLSVMVPSGWISQPGNDGVVRILSPDSNAMQFFQVDFFPPQQLTQDVRAQHSTIIGRLSGMMRPGSTPQNGTSGRFIWTSIEIQRSPGQVDIMLLYSAKSGPYYVGVSVDATNANLLSRHLAAVDAMVRSARFNDNFTAPSSSAPPAGYGNSAPPAGYGNSTAPPAGYGNSSAPPGNAGGTATLGDYTFSMPQGWTSNQYSDGIVLMSPMSVTNERCVVTLWPMRQANPGSNLLADANSIFQDVYKAYDRRDMTTRGTQMPQSMVLGTSGQGWDYAIVRRGVAPRGTQESRLAFVFIARLNSRLAVISGVSRDPLVSTCMGELASNFWPRFFYSLHFRGYTPSDQEALLRKRLVGVWTLATATASDQFTFAANGRYGGAAAAQQYNRINSSEILQTTQAYFGNGAYTLHENTMTLIADDKKNQPETALFRIEQESTDEGRSWKEKLYLLRISSVDGKEYEAIYGRQQ